MIQTHKILAPPFLTFEKAPTCMIKLMSLCRAVVSFINPGGGNCLSSNYGDALTHSCITDFGDVNKRTGREKDNLLLQ